MSHLGLTKPTKIYTRLIDVRGPGLDFPFTHTRSASWRAPRHSPSRLSIKDSGGFCGPDGDHDPRTDEIVARVQAGGEVWFGATTCKDMRAVRVSVVNWQTSDRAHRWGRRCHPSCPQRRGAGAEVRRTELLNRGRPEPMRHGKFRSRRVRSPRRRREQTPRRPTPRTSVSLLAKGRPAARVQW